MSDDKINLNTFDKIIKFRTLNKDHNFIFLKVKNTIKIYDPIKLNLIYSFYISENITKFEISPLDSSVILSTAKTIQLYELLSKNLQDYDLKIKYNKKYENNFENIEEISVSLLGDIFVTIDSFKNIKILNKQLTLVKAIQIKFNFLPASVSLFPLEFFNLTYDTKNICLCRYGFNNVSMVSKNKFYSSEENNEYIETVINFKTKILYFKEMQKEFNDYILYPDSSIYFMLGEFCNFLILRKIFEDCEIPNLIILSHIDLATQTESFNFPSISFSLLYNNQNPIFNQTESNTEVNKLESYLLSSYGWEELKSRNSVEEENSIFQVTSFYHKNISNDFLLFNFRENLILYKIEGLYSHPYNNIKVEAFNKVTTDKNFRSEFLLLKMTRTLDRRFCVYFLDENNFIRKFQFPQDSRNVIFDSTKLMKTLHNIAFSDHNEKNRKTLVVEYRDNKSILTILNSKLEINRVIVFNDIVIKNPSWVLGSDFFIFSYDNKLIIVNYISKYFEEMIVELTLAELATHHIVKELEDTILQIKLNVNNQVGHLTRDFKISGYNDTKFELLCLFKDSLTFYDIVIESNRSITFETEYLAKFSICRELLQNKLYDAKTGALRPVAFNEDKLYYYNSDYTRTNIFSIFRNDDIIFQTTIFTEILYANVFLNNNIIFITKDYINYYDIATCSTYRVKNNYLKDKDFKCCIDAFKLGIFTYLSFIDNKGVSFVRIPRNKNYSEEFSFVFRYMQEIDPDKAKMNIRNNLIILNESQILKLADITTIKHGLKYYFDEKILMLLNSSNFNFNFRPNIAF
jgi:hypothetical protein